MTNLTQQERDAIVEFLFSCETAFLVENLMNLLPEDDLKELGKRLIEDEEEETYDAFGVNTKNSFNTPPKEESCE
jgi:hypothetical protein